MTYKNWVLIVVGLTLLIGVTLNYSESTEDIHNKKDVEGLDIQEQTWDTYTNGRYGYSVSYPSEWKEGFVATNGDGRVLHKEGLTDIRIYGSLEPTDFSNNFLENEREHVELLSGQGAIINEKKEGDNYLIVVEFDSEEQQYVLYATMSTDFYDNNKDMIINVANTFKLSEEYSL